MSDQTTSDLREEVRARYAEAARAVLPRASAPTAGAVVRAASGTYTPVFAAVAFCALGAAVLFVAADRAHRQARAPARPSSMLHSLAADPG